MRELLLNQDNSNNKQKGSTTYGKELWNGNGKSRSKARKMHQIRMPSNLLVRRRYEWSNMAQMLAMHEKNLDRIVFSSKISTRAWPPQSKIQHFCSMRWRHSQVLPNLLVFLWQCLCTPVVSIWKAWCLWSDPSSMTDFDHTVHSRLCVTSQNSPLIFSLIRASPRTTLFMQSSLLSSLWSLWIWFVIIVTSLITSWRWVWIWHFTFFWVSRWSFCLTSLLDFLLTWCWLSSSLSTPSKRPRSTSGSS